MPQPIKTLLQGKAKPVTVTPEQPVSLVLELMADNDFSQLPVVNEQNQPIGIVTGESILHSLACFKASISDLRVIDVTDKAPQKFSQDSDVFDILPELSSRSLALIVDKDGTLIGVLTNYDTSEFFRRRAEDVMMIEEIEKTVREMVLFAFPQGIDDINDPALQEAVKKATAPERDEEAFKRGLGTYLASDEDKKPKIDNNKAAAAYEVLIGSIRQTKTFSDLSYSEYVSMLLSDDRWKMYTSAVPIKKSLLNEMLRGVAPIRNKIAHFSGELTATERRRLQICSTWLQNHYDAICASVSAFLETAPSIKRVQDHTTIDQISPPEPVEKTSSDAVPSVIEADASSMYAALTEFLRTQPVSPEDITLSFKQIEDIIGSKLPDHAYQYRSWWSNDPKSYSHAAYWLEAGWHVRIVSLKKQTVVFTLRSDTSDWYSRFFTSVVRDPMLEGKFKPTDYEASGRELHPVVGFRGKRIIVAQIVLHHIHGELGCVLLFLPPKSEQSTLLFEELRLEEQNIANEIGQQISWNPSNRDGYPTVTCHIPMEVPSDEAAAAACREWAVATTIRFYEAFSGRIAHLISKATNDTHQQKKIDAD